MWRLYLCLSRLHLLYRNRSSGGGKRSRASSYLGFLCTRGFTRMAGGFNPRRATPRSSEPPLFRKLAHYFIQRELSMACVGCGRCATVCHGDIGMPRVVEMIRHAVTEGKHA